MKEVIKNIKNFIVKPKTYPFFVLFSGIVLLFIVFALCSKRTFGFNEEDLFFGSSMYLEFFIKTLDMILDFSFENISDSNFWKEIRKSALVFFYSSITIIYIDYHLFSKQPKCEGVFNKIIIYIGKAYIILALSTILGHLYDTPIFNKFFDYLSSWNNIVPFYQDHISGIECSTFTSKIKYAFYVIWLVAKLIMCVFHVIITVLYGMISYSSILLFILLGIICLIAFVIWYVLELIFPSISNISEFFSSIANRFDPITGKIAELSKNSSIIDLIISFIPICFYSIFLISIEELINFFLGANFDLDDDDFDVEELLISKSIDDKEIEKNEIVFDDVNIDYD